jgi:hypothetical protein
MVRRGHGRQPGWLGLYLYHAAFVGYYHLLCSRFRQWLYQRPYWGYRYSYAYTAATYGAGNVSMLRFNGQSFGNIIHVGFTN